MPEDLKQKAEEQDMLTDVQVEQKLGTSTKVVLTVVIVAAVVAGVFVAIAMAQ